MVRKRTRTAKTRRNSRKDYDESDENESDISLDLESPPSSPPPKRYGLRQRKQPIFCEDYDYDEEDELNVNKHRSDDEEYNVEVDLIEVKETQGTRSVRNHTISTLANVSNHEPDLEESMDDGLIDFEDVIRADVVVNKQRVDYDNIINKTEIQVEEEEENGAKPVKEKGKRGRKPKPRPEPVEEDNVEVLIANFEDDSISLEYSGPEDDTNVEVQIDPANFVQTESDDSNPPTKSNGIISENNVSKDRTIKQNDTPIENGTAKSLGSSRVDEIEKYVPPELDEKEKEVVLSNEYLLANSFDIGADEFLEKQAQKQDEVEEEEEEENIPVFNFDDDSNSDDDVVIIEKQPEVIVLDDD